MVGEGAMSEEQKARGHAQGEEDFAWPRMKYRPASGGRAGFRESGSSPKASVPPQVPDRGWLTSGYG